MTLESLNALDSDAARDAFTACCGASQWVTRMVEARPFATAEVLLRASDQVWSALSSDDIRSAIAHHPRIGERPVPRSASVWAGAAAALHHGALLGTAWSMSEQSAALNANAATATALAEANTQYEHRFGHRFIVCAEGRSAHDLLAAIRARTATDAATELTATSEELRKITVLRLGKLLADA